MKKFLCAVIFVIMLTAKAYADCPYADLCPSFETKAPSKVSQFISNITGQTFLTQQVVQNVIKAELKKYTNQDFEVTVETFGIADLLDGKFKSLTITGNNINLQGFYISSLTAKTVCDFNSIDYKSKPIGIRENIVLDVSVELTQEDLIRTMSTPTFSSKFSKIDVSSMGISAFSVYHQTINIQDNALFFTINARPIEPHLPIDIAVGADVLIQDGNIMRSQINFINMYTGFDLTRFENYLNPALYMNTRVFLYANQTADIHVRNVYMQNNKAYLNGIIVIPKS